MLSLLTTWCLWTTILLKNLFHVDSRFRLRETRSTECLKMSQNLDEVHKVSSWSWNMWTMLIKYILLYKVFLEISLEFCIDLQLSWHLKFNNMSLGRILTKTDFYTGATVHYGAATQNWAFFSAWIICNNLKTRKQLINHIINYECWKLVNDFIWTVEHWAKLHGKFHIFITHKYSLIIQIRFSFYEFCMMEY
jgi:hypothetical protein